MHRTCIAVIIRVTEGFSMINITYIVDEFRGS